MGEVDSLAKSFGLSGFRYIGFPPVVFSAPQAVPDIAGAPGLLELAIPLPVEALVPVKPQRLPSSQKLAGALPRRPHPVMAEVAAVSGPSDARAGRRQPRPAGRIALAAAQRD